MPDPIYANLPRELAYGGDNTGGMGTEVLLATEEMFDIIKGTKVTGLPGDSVTIDGSHVFAPNPDASPDDYGFIKARTEQDISEFMSEAQGENGGRTFKGTLKIALVGQGKTLIEQARVLKNRYGIALIKMIDKKAGTGAPVYIQIGSGDMLCNFVPGWGVGQGPAGKKQGNITIEASMVSPCYFYEGAITHLTVAP